MRHFSKILLLCTFVSLFLVTRAGFVSAQGESVDFPYDITSPNPVQEIDNPTNISDVLQEDAVSPDDSILDQLTKYFRVSGTSYNPDNTGSPALNYVRRILNIVLGLISLIALVLIIFAFYLIFFAKEEESVKKAKKILTGVAIALAIMGLARFIVSFFFNVFTVTT